MVACTTSPSAIRQACETAADLQWELDYEGADNRDLRRIGENIGEHLPTADGELNRAIERVAADPTDRDALQELSYRCRDHLD